MRPSFSPRPRACEALTALAVLLLVACARPPSEPVPTPAPAPAPADADADAERQPALLDDAATTTAAAAADADADADATSTTAASDDAAPMPAAPPPTGALPERRLALERSQAYNRHAVHGADGERLAAAVALDLLPSGAAELREVGEHRRSVLSNGPGDRSRYRATTRRWRGAWSGYWRPSAAGFTVTLAPRELTCSIEHEERVDLAHSSEREDCPPAAPWATLRCTPSAVDWREAPLADSEREAPTWRCASDDPLSGAATPWQFGQDRCLREEMGMRGRGAAFVPCAGEPSFDAPATDTDAAPD
ncbi:MAG: hypothetical protein R3A79_21050 [Nannocystaceae bacterium]